MITKKAMQEAIWLSLALTLILIGAYIGGNITGLTILDQTNQTFGILPINETIENISLTENLTNITEPLFEIPELNITENITLPKIITEENFTKEEIFIIQAPAACSPPTGGDWDINGTDYVTCTLQDIILNGNLLIKNNASLFLNSSNLTLNQSNNNDYKIQVQDSANLTIYYSNITSSKNYNLNINDYSVLNITDSNLSYIKIDVPGYARYIYIINVTFKNQFGNSDFYGSSINTIIDTIFDGGVYFTGTSNNTLKNVIFTNNKEIRIRGVTNITLENVTLDVTGASSYISIASQGTGNITIRDFVPSSGVNHTINSSLGMWINFSRSNITRLGFWDYGHDKSFINSTLYLIQIGLGNTTIENSTITNYLRTDAGNITIKNSNVSMLTIYTGANDNITISNLAPGLNINNEFYDYNSPSSYRVNMTNVTLDRISNNVFGANSSNYLYNVTFAFLSMASGSNTTIVNSTFTSYQIFGGNAIVQNSTFTEFHFSDSTTNFTEPASTISRILFVAGNPKIYGYVNMPSSIYSFATGVFVTRYYPIYVNYSNQTYVPNREILISNTSHPTLFIGTTDANGLINANITFGDSNYTVNYNLSVSNNSKNIGLLTDTPIEIFINAPPIFSEIPNQQWQQDNSTTINLSAYFNDTEGNDLNFSINSIPQNIQISINNETGIATLTPNSGWYGTNYIMFNVTDGIDWTNSNNITLTVIAKVAEGEGGDGGRPPPEEEKPPEEEEKPSEEEKPQPEEEIPEEEVPEFAKDYYNQLGKLTIEGYHKGNCIYIKIDSSIIKSCIEEEKPELNINFELPKGAKVELPIKINYYWLIFLLILIILAILYYEYKKQKKKITRLEKELLKPIKKEILEIEEFVIKEEKIVEKDLHKELTKIRKLLKIGKHQEAKKRFSKILGGKKK